MMALALVGFAQPASGQTYLEEPARAAGTSDVYVTTFANLGDVYTRSFTMRYCPEKRVALWVAYPLNASLMGTGSRGDGWHPDPAIPESRQAVLYKGFKYGSGYDRGHQIPSADRLDAKGNEQTFQFTNATPQLHDFNGGIWAELEKVVRTWAKRSDTLYVVTGVVPGDQAIPDNEGRPVNIPAAYYKVVIRRNVTRSGSVEWSSNSILLAHENVDVKTWKENMEYFREHSLSIDELEVVTKETYFPKMAEVVGAEKWKSMKGMHPKDVPWWWK